MDEASVERERVRQARAGDRGAFARLVDAYWDRIRRWLFTLVNHAQLAEDLTQEVFVKVWIGLPALADDGHFRSWIFRIARNLALDHQKRPRLVPMGEALDERPGPERTPIQELLHREADLLFDAACDRLPTTYREAYLLWAAERLPFAELARILDISEVNARWRVSQARQFLLRELEPFLERQSR